MIIPNGLVLTAFIIALIHFGFNLYIKEYIELSDVLTPIIGMVSGSGALLLVAVIASKIYKTEDTVGMGDVKLLFPIGLLLGYKLLILMMLLACITTSVASFILIKAGKKTRKDLIPFGPFIVASTYFTLLFGENIITWYMSLLYEFFPFRFFINELWIIMPSMPIIPVITKTSMDFIKFPSEIFAPA
jgi:leader peptidase (prepilin peptidase)/N-methyltransferase